MFFIGYQHKGTTFRTIRNLNYPSLLYKISITRPLSDIIFIFAP